MNSDGLVSDSGIKYGIIYSGEGYFVRFQSARQDPLLLNGNTYPFESLPLWMQEKINVLRTVNKVVLVPGVGIKHSDNVFYVCAPENFNDAGR